MKKINIGIDIDDTITNTFYHLMPAVADFYNMELEFLKENKISYTTLTPKMKEQEIIFARNNFDTLIPKTPIKTDAAEYIEKLKKLGHKIIIITARNNLFFTDAYKTSYEYLKNNNIKFDKLICSPNKANTCKDEKIDVFIDDSINQCNSVKKEGIKTLLFVSPINENNLDHHKVYNWEEVYNYIIENYS